LIERLRTFFTEQIWRAGPNPRRGQALLYSIARVAYSTVRGLLVNQVTLRAAALTYLSVLSIVPFLAFAFAVLKGLGAYSSFIDGVVRPYLHATFGANRSLLGAIELILQFVDRTSVSTLGVVGLLTLVYTSVSLLSSAEAALNDIFGAPSKRPFLRQLTDYVTLLVTTPLLVVVAAGIATAAESSAVVHFLRETLQLGAVIDVMLRFTSLAVVGTALFALYVILPNVHVRPTSALLGAAIAALLWQGALMLYVHLQMGVASYSALYSVVSAVPVYLVWTYISWIIVLVGAQVAASHQNDRAIGERFVARQMDQALRELLAVALAAHVARDFLAGLPQPDEAALAARVELPPAAVAEILEALVRAGLLVRTVGGGRTGYAPARDPGTIRVKDLRDALRRDARADGLRADLHRQLAPELRAALEAIEEEERTAPRNNVTLRELAAVAGPAAGAAPAGGAPAPARPSLGQPRPATAERP
jgi:membrane protein